MHIKTYLKKIEELAKQFPDAVVIYAKDSEGNSFEKIIYEPSPGYFDGEDFDSDNADVNAVCVN